MAMAAAVTEITAADTEAAEAVTAEEAAADTAAAVAGGVRGGTIKIGRSGRPLAVRRLPQTGR